LSDGAAGEPAAGVAENSGMKFGTFHEHRPSRPRASGAGLNIRAGRPGGVALCAAAISAAAILGIARAVPADARDSQTVVKAQDVTATVVLPDAHAAAGGPLRVAVNFDVAPGWHIYGEPLPEDYTPTTVKFDDAMVAKQAIDFPKPVSMKFEAIGETFPVYTGKFSANGAIRLKPDLAPGEHDLAGAISFQECNNLECKAPQQARFEIPIMVAR
jgi:DsbC/DsbD-like thiol-disulfide interchange protein